MTDVSHGQLELTDVSHGQLELTDVSHGQLELTDGSSGQLELSDVSHGQLGLSDVGFGHVRHIRGKFYKKLASGGRKKERGHKQWRQTGLGVRNRNCTLSKKLFPVLEI